MNIGRVVIAATYLPLLAGCVFGQTPVWNHNPQSAAGPLRWGNIATSYATCDSAGGATGTKQAPIDVQTVKTTAAALPSLVFNYHLTVLEVENTGHVIEVVYKPGSTLRIGASPTDEYTLAQFHFHAPSEHAVNGKFYDAELHLVHRNMLDEIAVVGILLQSSPGVKPGLYDDIVKLTPDAVGSAGKDNTEINAKELLPSSKGFYTYTGSLTTPPCTESVRWFVLSTPLNVTADFVRRMHSVIGGFPGYEGYKNNNRPIVPLNGRPVLVVQ